MTSDRDYGNAGEGEDSPGRTTEQEVARGGTDWTPVALLTSVAGIIALLFVVALALAVTAYLLA